MYDTHIYLYIYTYKKISQLNKNGDGPLGERGSRV